MFSRFSHSAGACLQHACCLTSNNATAFIDCYVARAIQVLCTWSTETRCPSAEQSSFATTRHTWTEVTTSPIDIASTIASRVSSLPPPVSHSWVTEEFHLEFYGLGSDDNYSEVLPIVELFLQRINHHRETERTAAIVPLPGVTFQASGATSIKTFARCMQRCIMSRWNPLQL